MPIDEKQIEEIAKKTFRELIKSGTLTDKRVIDTPTEAFAPVNRRFVTLSSNIGSRPISSIAVVGQRFYDLTNNTPIWYTTAGWRNSVGSIVAINN